MANYARRFVDDALGFALTWNYWFNDAVSTASDVIALQLLLEFWTENFPGWAISLIFLVVVIALNVLSVKVYGEVRPFLWVKRTELTVTGRVLAQFAQGRDYCGMFTIFERWKTILTPKDLYHHWNCCQLWWKYGSQVHRRQILLHWRCSVRRWNWWLCIGLCHGLVCLVSHFIRELRSID